MRRGVGPSTATAAADDDGVAGTGLTRTSGATTAAAAAASSSWPRATDGFALTPAVGTRSNSPPTLVVSSTETTATAAEAAAAAAEAEAVAVVASAAAAAPSTPDMSPSLLAGAGARAKPARGERREVEELLMFADNEDEAAAWYRALDEAIRDFARLRLAAEALEAASGKRLSASLSGLGSSRQTDSLLGGVK
jgi:hypothetical protein